MDKESKAVIHALAVLILFSLLFTYYRSFVSREYEIISEEGTSVSEQADVDGTE